MRIVKKFSNYINLQKGIETFFDKTKIYVLVSILLIESMQAIDAQTFRVTFGYFFPGLN